MNLNNMKVGAELSKLKPDIKKIFFYRICGTGMGACACLAKEAGFEVAGADMTFSPPMSTYLEESNIPLMKLSDLSAEVLNNYDLIVVGNSVPKMSEYARFVEEVGVPFTSFPSFLGEFILKDKEVIGLAGTHGKTTSTYFIAQMLEALGEKPGYFVGGIINGRPPSRLGDSKYFVIESDEYDSAYFQKISKFRLYELNHMVLTSLEFDHADIFNSIEDIKNEFSSIIPSIPGEIIASDDYQAINELKTKYVGRKWSLYGEKSKSGPLKIETLGNKTKFSLLMNEKLEEFETNIIGTHNILNISGCLFLLNKLGFKISELKKSITKLNMVKRRQEVRGQYKGAIVIDDFAHHPKAIKLTLNGLKKQYPDKEMITVFEPISATARSSIFQDEFANVFNESDKVIIASAHIATTAKSAKDLDVSLLVDEINKKNPAFLAENLEELITKIDEIINENSLLVILSNRTCLGLWESDFVKDLT